MVDGHAGRYRSSGSHIDGVCDKDTLRISKSVLKSKIGILAMRINVIMIICGILLYFPSVGIDADADYSTLAIVAIEGDTRLGARADIAHEHVVKEEG